MISIILSTAVKYLMPLLLIFSFYLLLRGHNEPGGGFVGGLVASAAYALYMISYGLEEAKKILRVKPYNLIAFGLATACLSGFFALISSLPFMTGLWIDFRFPILGKIGTPFIFDVGVYFVVLGIVLLILFTLSEEN